LVITYKLKAGKKLSGGGMHWVHQCRSGERQVWISSRRELSGACRRSMPAGGQLQGHSLGQLPHRNPMLQAVLLLLPVCPPPCLIQFRAAISEVLPSAHVRAEVIDSAAKVNICPATK